jgi:hypothetical protein
VRRLLTGLDEAVVNDDLKTARSLLLQAEIAFAETGIRKRTIPAKSDPPPPVTKRSR